MALVKKALTAVNDNVELNMAREENGAISFQLPAGVAGTYVCEATLNGTDWVALQCKNVNDGTTANSFTTAGIYYSEYVGFTKARIRKTVGVAAETIALSVNDD